MTLIDKLSALTGPVERGGMEGCFCDIATFECIEPGLTEDEA